MIMRMCDRCTKPTPGNDIAVLFNKVAADNGKVKTVITVRQDLCEPCLTKFMQAFGRFKNEFLKGKDQANTDGQATQSGGELCATSPGQEGSGNF